MKQIQIIYTSDTHGHILPVNYVTGEQSPGGLLALSEVIRKDGNTLVLDGGDSLQGTPLIQYYMEHSGDFLIHPAAEGFRACGLDYFTLGNHDFNYGYEPIRAYLKAMDAGCVCANVKDRKGELPIQRYVIHTLENGVRIGLTGVVTDHVNIWEKPEHLEFLQVMDPYEAAKEVYEELKKQCDLTLCIYHGGYERDLKTGRLLSRSTENIACRIGQELTYDILLTGHQHMAVEEVHFFGTISAQPQDKAVSYVRLTGSCPDSADIKEAKNWNFHSELLTIPLAKGRIPEKFRALEDTTEHWLDQPIGEFSAPVEILDKLTVALYGSPLIDLINQVQLEESGADFSCTSLGNDPIHLGKTVSIREVYAAYTFANNNVVKRVTKEVLKEALERCASYFELENGKPVISDRFLKPKIEHYNYDFYAGLDYAFDLRKPVGERVVRMRRLDGSELEDSGTYTLVSSDYRATGTGGYEMIGDCPVVYTGADNMQDMLINYIRTHRPVPEIRNCKFEVIY